MFRTYEVFPFDLRTTAGIRIPCRVEITSRRDVPDVDPCNLVIDGSVDSRLSLITRSVIIDRIAEEIHGKSIDGPILGSGTTCHAPERIAVWAYWAARDQSRAEREQDGWRITIESSRVVVNDGWSVEYAPASGDR